INVHAQDLVFKYSASNNKTISIYQDSDTLIYKFGKEKPKPEIEIKRKLHNLGHAFNAEIIR
ncbi:hypothetical protein, partial [Yersinia pestis]